MISKVLCLLALVAVIAAQHGHDNHGHHAYSSQSIHRHDGPGYEIHLQDKHGHKDIDYRTHHAKYDFKYEVKDEHTHDIKSQHEARDGDHVKGYYELHEPNGSVRHVDYESDKKTGFHASVKHSTHHVHHGHH